ncbi:GNAT family N-acetyltransferase [Roseovarius faecimaris]|uniref:GNAT family N-acetyltransferase n=2 Tax=Roseovarius faecimaris TaxID=2494550 RepID=A0A6I6IXW0_9RHOB|nr:GNAT family N-acetyltransferase [Roseovarius faecimaris]
MPGCLAALWAFSRRTPWLPRARAWWEDTLLMARLVRRGWVRFVRDAHGTAGFLARDGARIHALYVHPRARGQGLGRALLEDAKAGADRLELWVVHANASARRFYAAQGFEEVLCSQGLGNDENLPDVLMVWHRPQGQMP